MAEDPQFPIASTASKPSQDTRPGADNYLVAIDSSPPTHNRSTKRTTANGPRTSRRRRLAQGVMAILACSMFSAGPVLAAPRDPAPSQSPPSSPQGAQTDAPFLATATLAPSLPGAVVPPNFNGLSIETYDLPKYASSSTIGAFSALLSQLGTGSDGAVLRLGGDSTDYTYWAGRSSLTQPGPFAAYPIYGSWLHTLNSLLTQSDAKAIIGVNLANDDTSAAITWVEAANNILGSSVLAYEIGNEPDQYTTHAISVSATGVPTYARSTSYGPTTYDNDIARYLSALMPLLTGGSALAWPASSSTTYLTSAVAVAKSNPQSLSLITAHLYPGFNACTSNQPAPPIASLLSDTNSAGLAASLVASIASATAAGYSLRVDELNSAGCGGIPGFSDTMAAAAWGLDTMFELLADGASGVNFQGTASPSAYSPIDVGPNGLSVAPLYYGQLAFAQSAPPGSRLIHVTLSTADNIKVWATLDSRRVIRVAIINKDLLATGGVRINAPTGYGTARLIYVQGPSLTSTSGITIGGQSFTVPTDGELRGPATTSTLQVVGSVVDVPIRPGQIALVTLSQP